MILFKKATDLHKYIDEQRKKGMKIAFVPTMGALHAGHIHLIQQAQQKQTVTVCSIFVNPAQFNDPGDFAKYPITIEKDILLLESVHCDILFLPAAEEIYPNGITHLSYYELGNLETVLEGKYRPGHFQGVCAVVHRLLEIVMPDVLYLGQKDYQQCLVIKKLIVEKGLERSIALGIIPTQRENDGLAMSSRNMRLDSDNRKKAPAIYQALLYIKEKLEQGDLDDIKRTATDFLTQKGFRVDYTEIADANDLTPVRYWDGQQKIVALAAAFLGEVRLIDNILLNGETPTTGTIN
jgi:pantoate--beta-alanine ligase